MDNLEEFISNNSLEFGHTAKLALRRFPSPIKDLWAWRARPGTRAGATARQGGSDIRECRRGDLGHPDSARRPGTDSGSSPEMAGAAPTARRPYWRRHP